MKQCPVCGKTYTDPGLNFCLEDGELLTQTQSSGFQQDDAPPTVVLNDARVTNPSNWPSASPPSTWQAQQNLQNQPFAPSLLVQSKDQTLPMISMILGIASILLICCYGGMWLGLPAAVLGFLGMRNADSNGSRYGGRGMAVAGMVLGVVSFLASLVFLMLAVIGNIT